MYRSVLPISTLRPGTCGQAGVQKAWCGDVPGKLFVVRETAKGLATVTAMAREAEEESCHPTCRRKEGDGSASGRAGGEELRAHMHQVFEDYPEPVHHIIERMDAEAIFAHQVWDIEVCPRWSDGNIVLIGDAAHALTPGLGQGANVALEDAIELCTILANVLNPPTGAAPSESIPQTLTKFWQNRIERLKEIHTRSRLRTERSKTSTVSSRSEPRSTNTADLDDFRSRLRSWVPSKSS